MDACLIDSNCASRNRAALYVKSRAASISVAIEAI